jgi:hypothetical protein
MRMKRVVLFFAALALVIAFTGALFSLQMKPIFAAEKDTNIVQKLVQGSPWEGNWDRGSLSFSFYLDGKGQLQGEILKAATAAQTGPLRWVEVKDGTLTFRTPSGTDYTFTMDGEGRLVGRLEWGSFRSPVTLWPNKK